MNQLLAESWREEIEDDQERKTFDDEWRRLRENQPAAWKPEELAKQRAQTLKLFEAGEIRSQSADRNSF